MENKCPLCGGNIEYIGLKTVECNNSDCPNYPKKEVFIEEMDDADFEKVLKALNDLG